MGLLIAAFERMRPIVTGGMSVLTPWQQVQPAGSGQFSGQGHGSVYQPSDVIHGDAPQINRGSVPAPSNFGAVDFPLKVWDKTANFGNTLSVYQGNDRGAPNAPK